MALLEVRELKVTARGRRLVGPLDLRLDAGERRALVGPSGSGKSLTGAAILGTTSASLTLSGRVIWDGRDVLATPLPARRSSGARMAFVSQDPQRSLNPQSRSGPQLEAALGHPGASRPSEAALELLQQLAFEDPEAAWHALPHELSGGQCQRICLGIAIAARPDLLVADEPTTALDAATQMQVLRLIERLLPETSALLFITHDHAAARAVRARPLRMEAGRVIEAALVPRSRQPEPPSQAPSTRGGSRAAQHTSAAMRSSEGSIPSSPSSAVPLVEVRDLVVRHPGPRGRPSLTALDGVSLQIAAGARVGLVGMSGAGKSTLIHTILGLQPATSGSAHWAGRGVAGLTREPLKEFRRRVQFVPQSARGSLAPRGEAVSQVLEPMRRLCAPGLTSHAATNESRGAPTTAHPRKHLRRRAEDLLGRVGLPRTHWESRPRDLSGGQCQRVAIARALATAPDLLIADEPLSGLDPDSRAGVEDLLRELLDGSSAAGAPLGLLLISHDLDSVARLCDRVVVLDAGRIAEDCAVEDLLVRPESPVAARLVEAHCLTDEPVAPTAPAA